MDFVDVVKKRRMVRNFTDEPVDPDVVARMLDLARRAPSAGFTQGQSFIVVADPEKRQKIAELCGEQHYAKAGYGNLISKAPVLVIPCTSEAAYHRRYQEADKVDNKGNEIYWPVPYWYMDIGCAVMSLLLAVVNEGLAAGFAGPGFQGPEDAAEFRQLLNMPEEVMPVGVIPIGHPAPDKRSTSLKRGRKDKTDVIHYETW